MLSRGDGNGAGLVPLLKAVGESPQGVDDVDRPVPVDDETVENLKQIKWWNWNEKKIKEYAAYFSDPNEFMRHVEEKQK